MNNNLNNEDNIINVKVEKHLWPDEVAQKRKAKKSKIITVTIFSIVFLSNSSASALVKGGVVGWHLSV